MALVTCPDCGTQVSQHAPSCVKCGRPIAAPAPQYVQPMMVAPPAPPPPQGMSGCRKAFNVVAGLMFFSCLVTAIFQGAQKGSAVYDKTGGGGSAPEEPAITVSAAELVSEYDANEVAADNRYKGKMVQVSGVVHNIGKDIFNNMFVTLQSGHPLQCVQVFFDDSHAGEIAGLSKGTSLTVKGRCHGLMMNVLVKDAHLVR